MSEAERADRAFREVTVADILDLVHAATPHFAMQIRNRIAKLIAPLPPDHPARILGEKEMERMRELGQAGEIRGVPPLEGERPLPSVALDGGRDDA
jgi:hypothetical protein